MDMKTDERIVKIGRRMAALRDAKGLTVAELAEKAVTSTVTISNAENGNIPKLSWLYIIKIADALDAPYRALIEETAFQALMTKIKSDKILYDGLPLPDEQTRKSAKRR